MNRRCLLLAVVLAILPPALGGTGEPDSQPAPSGGPKVLLEGAFDADGGLILVPVRFEGKIYRFVLDTGCTHNVFDTSLRERLGKPMKTVRVKTASDPVALKIFQAPGALVGKIDLRYSGPVVAVDLAELRRVDGRDIRGIVGMRTLRWLAVRLDFDRERLTVFESDGKQHPEWGAAVPIEFTKDLLPLIKATLPDGSVRPVQIDTGDNGSCTVEGKLFSTMVAQKKLKTHEALFTDLGKTHRKRSARLGDLTIGKTTYQGLVFDEGLEAKLGLEFLSRHVVTLDFRGRTMYLRPGRRFDRTDEDDMSGVHIWRISGEVQVHSVDRDSPARQAGIRPGDVVVKMDGRDLGAGVSLWAIRNRLKAGGGTKVTLTFRRGQQTEKVVLRLNKPI